MNLGHLSANTDIPHFINFGKILQKLEDPEGGFVEDKGRFPGEKFPEPGTAAARLGGEEALKEDALIPAPGDAHQGCKGRRTRDGNGLMPRLHGKPDQQGAGIAEGRGARIAGIGHFLPPVEGGDDLFRGSALVLGPAGDKSDLDAEMGQELEGPAGIFTGHGPHGFEDLHRPEAHISQIPNGGTDNIQICHEFSITRGSRAIKAASPGASALKILRKPSRGSGPLARCINIRSGSDPLGIFMQKDAETLIISYIYANEPPSGGQSPFTVSP